MEASLLHHEFKFDTDTERWAEKMSLNTLWIRGMARLLTNVSQYPE